MTAPVLTDPASPSGSSPRMSRRVRTLVGDRAIPLAAKSLLWVWAGASTLLALWTVMNAFKSTRSILSSPFSPPHSLELGNFSTAWSTGFGSALVNTVSLVLAAQALTLVFGAPAGYALARIRRRSSGPLTGYFALGMSVPLQTIVVPLFLVSVYGGRFMTDYVTGWWDPRLSLLVFYVVMGLPFNVFVSTAFFRTLPGALEEAAALDGAGPYRTFFSVMLPLARPGMLMLYVIGVIGLWNETFLVLVMIPVDQAKQTLPVALLKLDQSMQYTSNWGALFAGIAFVAVPMIALYAWVGRRIVEGMTMGAVK